MIQELKKSLPDLKEAEIEGILHILYSVENLTNSELITLTGLPKEVLRQFKSRISTLLTDSQSEEIELNTDGAEKLKNLNPQPYKWTLLSYETDDAKNLVEKLDDVRNTYKISPKRELDQFFATTETSVNKAMILKDKGVVTGKRIGLIGDDDLVSIVLGLAGENYQNVTVADVDTDLLKSISKISGDMGIRNVQTIEYNCKNNVPNTLFEKFDVIMTDPPYTKAGIELFLNRAVQMLSKSPSYEGKYILLFFGNSFKSPEKYLKVQEVINKFNLVIEDRIDKFSRYYGAESIGNASALYILKTTASTEPLAEELLSSTIYTYENQKEEKFPFVDHVVIKVFDVPDQIVKSKAQITKAMGDFCNEHKLKVVDNKITEFKNGGLTLTFILANSNLVVHTWPEFNAVHLDLITCAPIHKKSSIPYSIEKFLKSGKIEATFVN